MKIKDSLKIAEKIEKKANKNNENIALVVLAKGFKVLRKLIIDKTPNTFTDEDLKNFFKKIDSNAIGVDYRLIDIKKLRTFFKTTFKGKYKIPNFPYIDKDLKEKREKYKE